MAAPVARNRSSPDLPLLVIATGAAAAVAFFTGNFIEEDRCLDAGGRLLKAAADRLCQLPDGSYLTIGVLPTTAGARLGLVALYLAVTWAVYRLLVRYVRRAR